MNAKKQMEKPIKQKAKEMIHSIEDLFNARTGEIADPAKTSRPI
jgi:hypothetical protein